MGKITLEDIKAFLEERRNNRGVSYGLEDVQDSVGQVHNDHLFEALVSADSKKDLHKKFEQRDDIHSATELTVEHAKNTFDDDVFEAVPREVIDAYIQCSAKVLEDEIEGVYE